MGGYNSDSFWFILQHQKEIGGQIHWIDLAEQLRGLTKFYKRKKRDQKKKTRFFERALELHTKKMTEDLEAWN